MFLLQECSPEVESMNFLIYGKSTQLIAIWNCRYAKPTVVIKFLCPMLESFIFGTSKLADLVIAAKLLLFLPFDPTSREYSSHIAIFVFILPHTKLLEACFHKIWDVIRESLIYLSPGPKTSPHFNQSSNPRLTRQSLHSRYGSTANWDWLLFI